MGCCSSILCGDCTDEWDKDGPRRNVPEVVLPPPAPRTHNGRISPDLLAMGRRSPPLVYDHNQEITLNRLSARTGAVITSLPPVRPNFRYPFNRPVEVPSPRASNRSYRLHPPPNVPSYSRTLHPQLQRRDESPASVSPESSQGFTSCFPTLNLPWPPTYSGLPRDFPVVHPQPSHLMRVRSVDDLFELARRAEEARQPPPAYTPRSIMPDEPSVSGPPEYPGSSAGFRRQTRSRSTTRY